MRCICFPPTLRDTLIDKEPINISRYPNTHKMADAKDCHPNIDFTAPSPPCSCRGDSWFPLAPHGRKMAPLTTVGVGPCGTGEQAASA